jgi:hypothetical protein
MEGRKGILVKASLVGLIPAVLVGGVFMYIAWSENLSMTIRDENGVDWLYWFMVGGSWALPVFVLVTVIAAVVLRVRRSH